jgi:hypothetical protein
MTSPDAAWYPDPHDPTRIRWWDGATWTENVRDRPDASPAPTPDWAGQGGAATSVESNGHHQAVTPAAQVGTLEPPVPVAPAFPAQDQFPAQPAADAPANAFAHETAPAWPVGPVETAPPVMPSTPDFTSPVADVPVAPQALSPSSELLPPVTPDFTDTRGAPSIGASRLPPLPSATPPGGRFAEQPSSIFDPEKSAPSKPLRIALLAGVVVVATILGVGAYTTGVFDSVTGQGAREASSSSVEVVQGSGYSVEMPKDWAQTETPNSNVELAFVAPNGATIGLSRSQEETEADFDNPVVRQVAFDAMVRVQQALVPGLEVVGRVPTIVDGAAAEQITLLGALSSGETYTMVEIVAVHGQAPYVIVLGGTPEIVGDATVKTQFEQIVLSFKFD